VLVQSANERNLTSYRYFRLTVFALSDVALILPVNVAILALNVRSLSPWQGFGSLHHDISGIVQYSTSQWAATPFLAGSTLVFPCTAIAASFSFFGFFGIGREARVHYARMFSIFHIKVSQTVAPKTVTTQRFVLLCMCSRLPVVTPSVIARSGLRLMQLLQRAL
jgi:hypothetical protein